MIQFRVIRELCHISAQINYQLIYSKWPNKSILGNSVVQGNNGTARIKETGESAFKVKPVVALSCKKRNRY